MYGEIQGEAMMQDKLTHAFNGSHFQRHSGAGTRFRLKYIRGSEKVRESETGLNGSFYKRPAGLLSIDKGSTNFIMKSQNQLLNGNLIDRVE